MKISLNWLKKYVEIPETVSNEELIRLIGARLVEVEGVIDETHKYDNIYVVRVESCEKIPETHLTRCLISAGQALTGDGSLAPVVTGLAPSTSVVTSGSPLKEPDPALIQVVCGAPNVHEGMLAVWIAPGAVVPASVHEDAPFVIGKRKMRGFESSGMLAGADELDFDDRHEKIVEIDPEMAKPGDLLADVFELRDLVLEIENKSLTHRPDCFGMIGFAREVAGVLGLEFKEPEFLFHETVFPEGVLVKTQTGMQSKDNTIDIKISDTGICSRYTGALLKVTEATAEEKYLSSVQIDLAKAGMVTRSKIVDVTNYLMLLTGQPLHAFDADKFVTVGGVDHPVINVRLASKGEKLVLLDDTEVELNENDIIICSNEVPVALAGAMGGKSTMIDEDTKNVILESASFSLYNLRKTQMAHGIFSEAITRFTKGVPAGGSFNVLAEAVKEMGTKPIALNDYCPKNHENTVVKITITEINELLGVTYDDALIMKTLQNVGFVVESKNGQLEVKAPYWRTDIHIKEDVIEEVGRLLGYDNIEPTLPLHATAEHNKLFELKKQIRRIMSKYGANEVLTYSFVNGRLIEKANQDVKNSYKIVNSISPDLQFIRQSIVPSLLDRAYVNQKLPVDKFAMFEINEVYSKAWGQNDENVPNGKVSLGCVLAERKNNNTAFYQAKKYVAQLFEELNISVEFVPHRCKSEVAMPFEPVRTADIMLGDECVGVVGEFRNSVRNEFKLAPYLAGFEIVDLNGLLSKLGGARKIQFGLIKTEDLTVTTDKSYAEILREVETKYPDAKISPLSIYQAPGQKTKNISFRIQTWQ